MCTVHQNWPKSTGFCKYWPKLNRVFVSVNCQSAGFLGGCCWRWGLRVTSNNRLVYSPYYPPLDRRAALIKERCVDNGAKQIGHIECSTSDGGRGRCAGGTSVKSHETHRENSYENRLPVFSHEWCPSSSFAFATLNGIKITYTLYIRISAECTEIRLEITWILTIPKSLV